ncbi:hypothetical protein AC1031_017170 [Aphanomyces cochlioides]|nr:hypothetical protein AC1031_017170 [Aphanomyces cochlioides]
MKLFGLVLLAALVAETTATSNESLFSESDRQLMAEGKGKLKAGMRAVVAAEAMKKGGKSRKGDERTAAPTTSAPPPPPPTSYSYVCFKHHSCGLDGKRGERDRGISPIIPALDTKRKCCDGIRGVRAGSAWGRDPGECENCNGKK